jgi:hypothetical protein
MCEVLVSKVHYSGCPESCDKETKTNSWCDEAQAKGEMCKDPPEKPLGKSTSHEQCPDHRDEGYSAR